MAQPRELRDPIHGFIHRSPLEESIIDTRVFQRLRNIRQLAMAYLVYPGATHSRFEHSIGVMHVAGKMGRQLQIDEEQIQEIRISGLLHDIGHGPFSHVSEELLEKFYESSNRSSKKNEKIHELLTWFLISRNKELSNLFSKNVKEKIINNLKGGDVESIVSAILSGPLDADKQDYLLRDSYFCGVKYGVFDADRLISTLKSYPENHDNFIATSEGGVHAIEQFILAKYYMNTQVYRHKTRLITDSMIIRGLELGIEKDKIQQLRDLFIFKKTEKYLKNYLEWDDARLVNFILLKCDNKTFVNQIFKRLRERKLFKRIFSKRLKDFEASVKDRFALKTGDTKKSLEANIAEYISQTMKVTIDPEWVVFKKFQIKSAREEAQNNEGTIMVIEGESKAKFENVSALFESINQGSGEERVEVYAPIDYKNEIDKNRLLEQFNQELYTLIEEFVSK